MPPPGPEVSLLSSTAPGPGTASSGSAAEFSILEGVPSLADLGYTEAEAAGAADRPPFKGGESEGLRRMEEMLGRTQWVADFEKPKTDPSAFLTPGTTVLSPYLKFGCVSARLMHERLQQVYRRVKKHSQPPVSLEGQLLWREFFYTAAYGTPNFDRMEGSPICRQIPFEYDEALLTKWRDAQTGFPWIDAIMTQLREWGWMHHLARHCVACFLTRGDLFVHWELGRDVFDRLLLDADWAINNGNWLWLSASAFFSQYHRVYSPVTFGKKYDPQGKFIKRFLPVLKDMPAQYIYEPWTAPLAVQKKAKCIIGQDYPHPVVDHAEASKVCKSRMADAYGTKSKMEALMGEDDDEESTKAANSKKRGAPAAGKAGLGKSSKKQATLDKFTKKK